MSQCKYEQKDIWGRLYQCRELVWPECSEGFCICHSPDNGKDESTARQVWEKARTIVTSQAHLEYVFKGWHFPADPDRKWFMMCIFRQPAYFENAIFQSDVNFYFARFRHAAIFTEAIFKGLAVFEKVKFHRYAIFNGSVFHGEANFTYSTFVDVSGFDNVRFESDASFTMSVFRGSVTFSKAVFTKQADWASVHPREGASFSLSLASVFHQREQGEGLYRLAKESARRQGNYRMAGKYYYAEQCAIEYGNRKTCRCKLWHFVSEWLFARMIFGYGEKPHRPFVTGLVVIVIWAVLYFAKGGIAPSGLEAEAARLHEPGFGECFYFSLVTFTTLGYGDMAPKTHILFRLLAGGEALLGAGLMALFVVALARKYTR